MDAELYKATMDVISDTVKILGPAIITAIVGYKVGKSQLLLKIEELNKNNEFKAREKIFDFHKEKLAKVDESIASLNEGLGQFAGMTIADLDDELNFSSFINKYLVVYIDGLPFQLNHINDELKDHSAEFSREYERLQVYIKRSEDISKPKNPEDIQSTIVELIEIYGFASHCIRILIEKEALEIFAPYTGKA
jgi:hypothetical protein